MLCLGGGAEIPLRFDERGLSIVDLAAVLLAPRAVAHMIADIAPQADKVLHTSTLGKDLTFTHETTHNKASTLEQEPDQSLPRQPISKPSACATDFVPQPSLCDGHAGLAEQGGRQAPAEDAGHRHGGTILGSRGQQVGTGDPMSPRVPGNGLCQTSRCDKVVYVSHCGQLIRAAPEQLRSASMREWKAISDVAQGSAQPRQLVDIAAQGELPAQAEVDQRGPPPTAAPSLPVVEVVPVPDVVPVSPATIEGPQEQPEQETSPAVSEAAEGDVPPLEEPMIDAAEIPVPEDDDEDLLFGDTECFLAHPLAHPLAHQVWEIGVHETDVEP